jgi:hypothetical protein
MRDDSSQRQGSCRQFRRTLLALPDPRVLPSSLRRHQQHCPDCRAWAEQAAELEKALSQLPVPPSGNSKAHFLKGLQQTESPTLIPRSRRDHSRQDGTGTRSLRSRRRWWWTVAGALAASLLVGVLAYHRSGSGPSPQPEVARSVPPYPFVQQLVAHDVALARANTASQRLQALSALADTVAQETQALARIATAEELRELVRWYDKVVERGVLQQAQEWIEQMQTEQERQQLLATAERLAATAQAMEKILDTVPPHAQSVLRQLAQTAREGEHKLKRLSGTS